MGNFMESESRGTAKEFLENIGIEVQKLGMRDLDKKDLVKGFQRIILICLLIT